MFKNPEVPFESALTTLAILVVSGILAGLIPARRAVKISPGRGPSRRLIAREIPTP